MGGFFMKGLPMLGTLLTLNALGYVAAFVAGIVFGPKIVAWGKSIIAKLKS